MKKYILIGILFLQFFGTINLITHGNEIKFQDDEYATQRKKLQKWVNVTTCVSVASFIYYHVIKYKKTSLLMEGVDRLRCNIKSMSYSTSFNALYEPWKEAFGRFFLKFLLSFAS